MAGPLEGIWTVTSMSIDWIISCILQNGRAMCWYSWTLRDPPQWVSIWELVNYLCWYLIVFIIRASSKTFVPFEFTQSLDQTLPVQGNSTFLHQHLPHMHGSVPHIWTLCCLIQPPHLHPQASIQLNTTISDVDLSKLSQTDYFSLAATAKRCPNWCKCRETSQYGSCRCQKWRVPSFNPSNEVHPDYRRWLIVVGADRLPNPRKHNWNKRKYFFSIKIGREEKKTKTFTSKRPVSSEPVNLWVSLSYHPLKTYFC